MKLTGFFSLSLSFLFLLPLSVDAKEVKGSPTRGGGTADFDGNGIVGEGDLLRLIPRTGSSLGEPDYSYPYDLDGNESIDGADLTLFSDQWKESGQGGPPFPVDAVRAALGLNNLPGTIWKFSCLEGSTENCTGEERTLTLVEPRTAFGRSAIPLVWGSGDGESWAEILLSATGPLQILGVDKVGGPEGLPGFQIPANMAVELGGPILWSTSEMMYPGSLIVNEGTGTLFATPTLKGFEGKGFGITGICLAFMRVWFGITPKTDSKGPLVGSYILSGEGEFDYGMGTARADWDLVCRDGRVRTLRLCWHHGEERKCTTYGEVEEGGDCASESGDFPNSGNGAPYFMRGECVGGSLENNDDQEDWFIFESLPSDSNLRIAGQGGEFTFLGIQVFVGSPIESDLVDSGILTSQGPTELIVNTPSGDDCYIRIYQIDGFGAYEVSAETVVEK